MQQRSADIDVIDAEYPTMNDEWDMQERRSFPRTGLEMAVQLTVVPAAGEDGLAGNLDGVTHDMSRGGCAVITDAGLADRTRCIVRFPLATGQVDPDTVWAEVRRSEPCADAVLVGLEFDTPLDALRIAPGSAAGRKRRAALPKVLVVDDQSGVRGLLSRYLGECGFDVLTAGDGEEAFRILLKESPDVLLLDLYLPRLNGHDLLRRMRDMEVRVELIMTMSGYADTTDAQECLRLGATDHLLKPIDVEHLHRSILLRLGAHTA